MTERLNNTITQHLIYQRKCKSPRKEPGSWPWDRIGPLQMTVCREREPGAPYWVQDCEVIPGPNQQFSRRLRATGRRGHLSQHLCLAAEQGSRKQQIYFLENGTSSLDSLLLFPPSKLSKINVAKNKMPYRLLILTLTTAHKSEELAWNE